MRQLTVGIVIPTFNGVRFLREAIESVLSQDYPFCECIVVDGGSTDGSQEILEAYGPRLHFISEGDHGQADAIKKGFAALECDLIGWLNADDRLLPGAVSEVVRAAMETPSAVLIQGGGELIEDWGRLLAVVPVKAVDSRRLLLGTVSLFQPGSFYRRTAVEKVGGIDPQWYFSMDLDLWLKLLRVGPAVCIAQRLAQFRIHASAKSSQLPFRYHRERWRLMRHYCPTSLAFAISSLFVSIHFFRLAVGISPNFRRVDPPVRLPPKVAIGVETIPMDIAKQLEKEFQIEVFETRGAQSRPDIVVRRFNWQEEPPPRSSISSLARKPVIPEILCIGHPPTGGALEWLKHNALSAAFAICEDGTSEIASHCGFPDFRIGVGTSTEIWQRAIAIASGKPCWQQAAFVTPSA